MKKLTKDTFFILFLVLFLLLGIEGSFYILNETKKPFLFNTSEKTEKSYSIRRGKFKTLDPLLGYAREKSSFKQRGFAYIPGYRVYQNPKVTSPLVIAIYGGSTSDPIREDTWSTYLYEKLRAENYPVTIYNGGVSGYSSSQEMLKYLRDSHAIKPDIVISLSGVNDMYFVHSVDAHPLHHSYLKTLYSWVLNGQETQSRFMPNTFSFLLSSKRKANKKSVRKITYGLENTLSDAQNWEKNASIMNATAHQFGSSYLSFLQPAMGYLEFPLSAEEKKMMEEAKERKNYLSGVLKFYNKAVEIVPQHDFMVNITDIFRNETAIYRDPRHPNEKGNKLIASVVFEELKKRDLLKRPLPNTASKIKKTGEAL